MQILATWAFDCHLVQGRLTQDEVPLLGLGAPIVGGIGLHPRPLDAVGLEACTQTTYVLTA